MNQLAALIYITTKFINRMSELTTTPEQKTELANFANAVNVIIDTCTADKLKSETKPQPPKEVSENGTNQLQALTQK